MVSPAAEQTLRSRLASTLGAGRIRPLRDLPGVWLAIATSAEEVEAVLAVARDLSLPVLPRAGDLDLVNVQAPPEGGLVLDVEGMNRILEVDHSERYAVVEPGVTWRQLELRLVSDGGDLALPVPSSPPGLTVWSSAIMGGVGGLSLAHGGLGGRVWGVEAITAEGRRLVTGSASMGVGWWGRGALPDLTGLFLGWRGATAVVTRLAVSLQGRAAHRRRLVVPATARRAAVAAAVRLAREGLSDEVLVVPWTLPRLLHGVRGRLERQVGEPEAWLHVDFSAETRPELEYKRLRLHQALTRAARRGGAFDEPVPLEGLAAVSGPLGALADLPLRLPRAGDGERWSFLAAHGPTARLVEAAALLDEAWTSEDLPPNVLMRPVRGGHFGLVHVAVPVARQDAALIERICGLHRRVVDGLFDLGFVPHRFRPEVAEQVAARMDPGAREVAAQIHALLDPKGLLDPGNWGLTPAT